MKLNELQKRCHDLAMEKGFWGTDGKDIRNTSELLMLIVSELGEACEALRKGLRQQGTVDWAKDTFEDEVADSVIRICDMAEALGINLEWQIEKKLEYNKQRPYKHNKEF
jgi:NTP pyrophosphatase (non-canonical NTP hydrolase)